MEQERDVNQVLMNVKGVTGGVVSVSTFSARMAFKLLTFLLRLAKKGLVSAGFGDKFKEFTKTTSGNYNIYNMPLTGEKAENLRKINQLELKLMNTDKKTERATLRKEIEKLHKEIPELEQLKQLGVSHCVLPKLNGSDQTIQIAVEKGNSDQIFKNWFLNHLAAGLSGGEKGMEDIKVFTEGNYTTFNMPFEGEELKAAMSDFDIMGTNYAVLPDLKVGDGNSQLAVPNADRNKIENWFQMWKEKQLQEGKEPGEMYSMDQESYLATSRIETDEYIAGANQEYKDVNAEFEAQAKGVPWPAELQKENCQEYVQLLQDNNFEKITINKESLVENMSISKNLEEMKKKGYFISRVPGTYGNRQNTMILPRSHVFSTDNGKTYIAFLPKNKGTMVADAKGNITARDFQQIYAPYDRVARNMRKVDALQKGEVSMKNNYSKKTPTPANKPVTPNSLKL